MTDIPDVETTTVIIRDKLYFCGVREGFRPPTSSSSQSSHVYFTTDSTLVYTAFFADFGPLNLGLVHTFCQQLSDMMNSAASSHKRVVYYCTMHPHRRANSAVLLCAYLIFVLNYSAERAYAPFIRINPPLYTFRDAGFCINTFPITVLDCARAMRRAVARAHYTFTDFNLQNFQRLAKLQHGDISWIVPGKFIAFSGPVAKKRQISVGVNTLSPAEYVPVMRSLGVTCIVRFNSKCYDRTVFTSAGIRHVDLYYEDGGNPTEAILQAFLQLCEHERGAIAVHCKAGLGRTGTNIAAYMMKHYGYTAREATAWCRICRPGSIVGPQQQYLCSIEDQMKREGEAYRVKHGIRETVEPPPTRSSGTSTPPLVTSNGRVSPGTLPSNQQFKSLFRKEGSGSGAGFGSNSSTGSTANALTRSNGAAAEMSSAARPSSSGGGVQGPTTGVERPRSSSRMSLGSTTGQESVDSGGKAAATVGSATSGIASMNLRASADSALKPKSRKFAFSDGLGASGTTTATDQRRDDGTRGRVTQYAEASTTPRPHTAEVTGSRTTVTTVVSTPAVAPTRRAFSEDRDAVIPASRPAQPATSTSNRPASGVGYSQTNGSSSGTGTGGGSGTNVSLAYRASSLYSSTPTKAASTSPYSSQYTGSGSGSGSGSNTGAPAPSFLSRAIGGVSGGTSSSSGYYSGGAARSGSASKTSRPSSSIFSKRSDRTSPYSDYSKK